MEAKNIEKVITLQDFIDKSIKKYENRKLVVEIEVDGDLIPFCRPSDAELLRYIDDMAKAIQFEGEQYCGQDTTAMLDASKVLVYSTCKFLHEKTLLERLDIVEPTDVVVKIFGITGTIDMAQKIQEAFEGEQLKEKVDNAIKN